MISAVIPAFNEEKIIGDVIQGVQKYVDEIIVIGSPGSTDRTAEVARSMGAKVLMDNGKGKGDALRVGIENASGDILMLMDADGSHIADDIPRLVEPIESGTADMVIASRMTGGSEELHGNLDQLIRLFGSSLITLIINYRFKVRISDSQNGFRSISAEVAKDLDLRANIFDIETEMLMKCLKKGYRVKEVPSRELERKFGTSGVRVFTMWPRYLWRVLINLF